VKQGESAQTAFTEIYREHAPKVWRMCLAYAENEAQAQDFMQETFIKVWQHLESYRGEAQISTWIYRIAVNTCLSHIRSSKNKSPLQLDEHYEVMEDNSGAEKEQQVQQLYAAIRQLPETDRLIITMVLEQIPYPEIAAAINVKEGNLRVKIHRIKQELTKLFSSYEQV
jgi:RNA polymerase sigma factor (sigma-70 family)